MARLGLDIDLALQRLLGANKERAAANRAELQDRKLRRENAAEKAQLAADAPRPGAPTQDEEIRGGTPQLYNAPKPAAQRRKKNIRIYGLSNVSSFVAEGTYQQFTESFTAYGVRSPTFGVFETTSFPLTNTFTTQATRWRPLFSEELPSSRKIFPGDSYTVSNAITDFEWYFTQKADETFALTGGAAGQLPSPIIASPPVLPFLVEGKVFVDETALQGTSTTYPWAKNGTSITRSDGRYIYHSRIIRTASPGSAITQGRFIQNSIYDTDHYESTGKTFVDGLEYDFQYTARAAGRATVAGRIGFGATEGWRRPQLPPFSDEYDFTYNLYTYYGLYWRFDSQTREVTFSSSVVGNEVENGSGPALYGAAALWLNRMDSKDPTYRLWVAYKASFSGVPEYIIAAQFLTDTSGFLSRWPETLTYNEDTGYLTIVTTLAEFGTPRIFTKKVAPITYSYAAIPIFELPSDFSPTETTEQEMLNSGWVNKGLIPQNTLDPLDQYFAFEP